MSILYIWQTWPIFKLSISNLAKGQFKQGKLYFAKIFSAPENFKISAKVVSLVNLDMYEKERGKSPSDYPANQPPSITTVEPVI